MGITLYEIAGEYRVISEEIDAEGGELSPELEARLDAVNGSLAEKIDSIGAVMAEARADAESYRAEAERLADRARAANNKRERLKAYLLRTLKDAGLEKVKGSRFTVKVRKSGKPSIAWADDSLPVPPLFTQTRVELNRSLIQEAYRAGKLPPGFVATFTEYAEVR